MSTHLLRPLAFINVATYSVAFEEHIQVLCGLAVLVVIEGALVDGVLAIRLGTVAAIEAFLPQSLCGRQHQMYESKSE